eukprot:CAMPEP_0118907032 /NCGR_PEP_ID=MMETSP1166-20130328/10667_1 /TAXON_ID=1104430 /ORGANISM="Chrysoreinhardia sp, Strain CCMP3193" /LENGTH=166 /DNA_ID=CAMNT_0006846389 /DNA_START=22 /DNA_END=518 /DNA_ORIENTATION=+
MAALPVVAETRTTTAGGRTRYCWPAVGTTTPTLRGKGTYVGPSRRRGDLALYAGRDFAGGDVTLATSAVAWVFFGPKDRAFLEARCAFCGATKAETLCDKCENAYFCESCRDGRPHVCEARASPSLRLAAMAARTCDEAYLRRNASRKTLDPFAVAAVRRLLSAAA